MPNADETPTATVTDEEKKLAAKKVEFRELNGRLKEVRDVIKMLTNHRKELETRHNELGTELGKTTKKPKA